MSFTYGVYTLPGPALVSGDIVSATENNQFRNDVAGAFNVTFLRNGTSTATANLPMGGYKLTGLGVATTSGDALSYGQAAVVTTLNTTGITDSGNLTFTGTGNRITGDFSNVTATNRVAFQTSTANGFTNVPFYPDGTGTQSGIVLNNAASSIADRSTMSILCNGLTDATIRSGIVGSGTYLPMTFYTSGSEKLRIAADATGTYTFGGTAPRIIGDFSNATIASRLMFQSSVTNAITAVEAIPNGTALNASLVVSNSSSDPANSSYGSIQMNGSAGDFRISSGIRGTGTYYPMTFWAGNAERMRIDSSGNVGIGTSSPSCKLNVVGSSNTVQFRVSDNALSSFQVITGYGSGSITAIGCGASEQLAFYTNGSANERMRIDSSGNVGIGTSSPSSRLDIAGSATAGMTLLQQIRTGPGNSYGFQIKGNYTTEDYLIQNYYSGNLAFGTNNAERMRIDSSGNLLVGTTSSAQPDANYFQARNASPSGFQAAIGHATGTGSGMPFVYFVYGGSSIGSITQNGTTAVAYNTSSDYRLKENIQPMQDALAVVQQLNPVTYTWKADGSDGQGFIAHELQAVVPDCVTGEKDATRIEKVEIEPAKPAVLDEEGNEIEPAVEAVYEEREVPVYQGIDTSFLVATLAKAIQELKAEVDAQALEIAALKQAAA